MNKRPMWGRQNGDEVGKAALPLAGRVSTTIDPAAALEALAPKWAKDADADQDGRTAMEKALEKAADVEAVYAYCDALNVPALEWLRQHWAMSGRSAQLYRRLYRERERLPNLMAPTVAFRIFKSTVPESAVDEIISLVESGVKVTVAMAETITSSTYLVGAAKAVSAFLMERSANGTKPKVLAAELKRLHELMAEAQARGYVTADGEDVALSQLFTQAVNDVRDRDADVELLRNEHFDARVTIIDGRVILEPVNVPADMYAMNGVPVHLIWRERADCTIESMAA